MDLEESEIKSPKKRSQNLVTQSTMGEEEEEELDLFSLLKLKFNYLIIIKIQSRRKVH